MSHTVRTPVAEWAHQAADNVQESAASVGETARQAVSSIGAMASQAANDGGKYLENSKLTAIAENITHLIRRNPIPAVLIGIGLGWFACRKLKG